MYWHGTITAVMADIYSPDQAADALLRLGTVGVLPTDTVYGLVARAADMAAVTRLYGLKQRDHKPGTIIAASTEQLIELGIPARYIRAVEQFWPNPVSIVLPHTIDYLHQGLGAQPFRIPADTTLRKLLMRTGPLQTTSANQPGEPPATTVVAAKQCFGDEVDFYVDGGDLSGRESSTIIRVVDDTIDIIRPGALKITEQGEIIT